MREAGCMPLQMHQSALEPLDEAATVLIVIAQWNVYSQPFEQCGALFLLSLLQKRLGCAAMHQHAQQPKIAQVAR